MMVPSANSIAAAASPPEASFLSFATTVHFLKELSIFACFIREAILLISASLTAPSAILSKAS